MPCEKCAITDPCGSQDIPDSKCKHNCDCHEFCYQELIAKHEESFPEPDEDFEDEYP